MPVSVTMPRLGESVTEGTVTRWLKQEGERVEVDEPLLEVSTDKVDTEIPSPAAGVLSRIVVQQDETVPVGAELAVIGGSGGGGGTAPAAGKEAPAATPEAPQRQEEPEPEPAAEAEPAEQERKAEPQPEPAARERTAEPQPEQPKAQAGEPPAGEDGGYVTPLVRKLASEHRVDLS